MGMLVDAKKKHKKHHAKPAEPVNASGPDAEPEGDAETPDEGGAGDQESPDPGPEKGATDPNSQGAAPAAEPQGPEDGGTQGAEPQPDQGEAPSGDAGQDQSQGAGAQGAAPPEGAPDDSAGGQQGQPGAPQDHVDLSKIPISPALKEEFMNCNAALHTALYTNDKVVQAVLSGIVPQGPHKVESVARMATLLVVQINKQLHFIQQTPQVVMPFTQDVVEHVLDLAVRVKGIQFSEQEAHAALGTALEIIMHTCGVTKKQMQAVGHALPRSQIMDGLNKYKAHLQNIRGVQGPNSPEQNPGGAPSPAGAAPDQGGPPASMAGGPPGGQPQPGAPVTAAPGPGQSAPPGGMLTAAQAPQ